MQVYETSKYPLKDVVELLGKLKLTLNFITVDIIKKT